MRQHPDLGCEIPTDRLRPRVRQAGHFHRNINWGITIFAIGSIILGATPLGLEIKEIASRVTSLLSQQGEFRPDIILPQSLAEDLRNAVATPTAARPFLPDARRTIQ